MRPLVALFVAFVALVALACGSVGSLGGRGSADDPGAAVAAADASLPPVVRSVLAEALPAAAPDDALELVRYTIQPSTALAPHRHPGTQLALIQSGTLTYTVIEGEVTVHQVDGGTRVIGPGETSRIAAGEWIVEDESIVHYGANEGKQPVVILASSLLEADQPPAIPVETPAPS
jgi:quercetin dioxygenase-like cupin family protein